MKYLKISVFAALLSTTSLLMAQEKTSTPDNPLLQEWNTPYQTIPFDLIRTEHYLPAMQKAIAEARQEVDNITRVRSVPTFENTIIALERVGATLSRVAGVFYNVSSFLSTPEIQQIAREISPLLTEYSNDVSLNEELFQRVKMVYDRKDQLDLATEQALLLENTYKSFARSGANLRGADKEKYRELSKRLSELSLQFNDNELAATNAFTMHLTKASDLKGLPESAIKMAEAKAKSKNLKGWLFDLSYPSYGPFVKYAENRNLRKKIYMASSSRALGGKHDNTAIIKEIANLRLQMANVLGYKTYADYVLEERMAEKAVNVNEFLAKLAEISMPYAQEDVKTLQEYAKAQGLKGTLERWDLSFYSEKLRSERYSINDELLKPYFELNKTRDGIFLLCKKLYGLEFLPAEGVQSYHKDVQIYNVFDEKGKYISTLYLDFYARDTKRGGAWMNSFRDQYINNMGLDVRPHISLVLNFAPPSGDEPVLLTFYDFTTFLHEFGHALHGMLSECAYTSTSGTSVPRDFVELPSQIMENWATEKAFLDLFATHYQTGEAIPQELIDKLVAADNFQAGYASMRQLMLGTLDMTWHSIAAPITQSAEDFERQATAKTEVMPVVEGTLTSPAFGHIFGGGYAAGYYGYKWAEVLDADAYSVFKKNGIFDAATAKSFRDNILSKGGSDKPMKLYIRFRGQEPDMDALLIRSGLKK